MFRYVLLAALLASSAAAHAELIRFDVVLDVNYNQGSPTNWTGAGPAPTTIDGHWVVDTSSFTASTYNLGLKSQIAGDPVLYHFGVNGLAVAEFSLFADGQSLWSGQSGASNISGNAVSPFSYDSTLSLGDGNGLLSFGDTRTRPVVREADFSQMTDPAAYLLQQVSLLNFALLSGDWGRLALDQRSMRVSNVPEPASFGLLGLGLVAMGLVGRVRFRRR